jgi:hypothetical protein
MVELFQTEEEIRHNKCTYSPLGASNHSNKERQKEDYYATPPIAVKKLLDTGIELSKNIWEPACGEGHISKVLEQYGYNVRSTDIINRGYGSETIDFLYEETPFDGDIVTNPPYRMGIQFVSKGFNLISEGHKIVMLLRLCFLEGKERGIFFKENPPRNVYVFSSRIACAKNGEFQVSDGSTESGAVAYAWFEWIKGFRGKPEISWI